jgi:hypothetical protein
MFLLLVTNLVLYTYFLGRLSIHMNIDNEDVKTTNCIKELHNNGNIESWRHNQEDINRVFKCIFSKEKA